jgi:hypothetical protein
LEITVFRILGKTKLPQSCANMRRIKRIFLHVPITARWCRKREGGMTIERRVGSRTENCGIKRKICGWNTNTGKVGRKIGFFKASHVFYWL